jgi:regulator of RNase E activity RraA
MIRNRSYGFIAIALGAWLVPMLAPTPAQAQLWTWTKDQMMDYTKAWTGDRFPDGRPKVPDALLERARGLSMEEIMINWGGGGPGGPGGPGGAPARSAYSQYEDGWQVLHPGKTLVGRAVTMAFMPARPDLDSVVMAKAKEKGIDRLNNQTVLDMLQPGDVLVVDLYGKKDGGTIVGDNLFYYIMKTTKTGGLVVDGAMRDLQGIAEMDMPAYYRSVHPSWIGGVTLSAVNVPVRIGDVTVMPGDVVVGDREGVTFIPPQMVQRIVDSADTTHVHDEWTRKKFDEGKYKSSDIYGSPRDPALKQEYQEYLKKRLEEIRKSNPK